MSDKIYIKTTILIVVLLSNILFSPDGSLARVVDLTLNQGTLTANLDKVSLKTVLSKICKRGGIKVHSNESLLDEMVSVQFSKLSLHHGLKRILANLDYCLIFDSSGKIVSVFIYRKLNGKSIRGLTPKRDGVRPSYGTKDILRSSFNTDRRHAADYVRNESTTLPIVVGMTGGQAVQELKDKGAKTMRPKVNDPTVRQSMKTGSQNDHVQLRKGVEKRQKLNMLVGSSPSGAKIKVRQSELEGLRIEKSVDPPGGPVEINAEEFVSLRITKGIGPPGGLIKILPTELESLTSIKVIQYP